MKRYVLLIVCIFIFTFCIYAVDPNMTFSIVLNREGFTNYYFAEKGGTTRISSIVFSFPTVTDSVYQSVASLRFGWEIYEGGTYSINLVFASPQDGYMLGNVDLTSPTKGYNYSIRIDRNTSSVVKGTILPSDKVVFPDEANVSLAVEGRTLTISNLVVDTNNSTGNAGHIDLDLTLASSQGFTEGQYAGEIAVTIETL